MNKQKRGPAKSKKKMLFGNRKRVPCKYCEKELTFKTATLDHVIPLSKGGYDRLKNVVICCDLCNKKKGDLHVHAFLKTLD